MPAYLTTVRQRALSTAVALPALLVLLAATAITLSSFAGWLREMHGPGGAAFAPEQALSGGAEAVVAGLRSWLAFHLGDAADRYVDPPDVLALFLAVDSFVFVPVYVATGLLVLRRGGAAVAARQSAADRSAAEEACAAGRVPAGQAENGRRETFRWGQVALGAVAAVDLAENLLSWLVFDAYWPDPPDGTVRPRGSGTGLAAVLQWVTRAKWALALVVAVALLVLLMVWVQQRRPAAATTLRLVRVQVVTVVALALALFMPLQVPDTILTWRGGQFSLVIVLSLLLALTQWALTRHVLDRARRPDTRVPGDNALVPGRFYVVAGVVLAAVVVVAYVSGLTHDKNAGTALRDAASGAGVLVVAAGVVLGLSRLVRAWAPPVRPPDKPDETLGGIVLPRVLAAAVPVVVGLATLRVTVPTFVLRQHGSEWWRLVGAFVLLATGVALYAALIRLEDWAAGDDGAASWWSGRWWVLFVRCGLAGTAVAAHCVVAPFAVAPWLSAVGVVLVFLVVLTFVAGLLLVAAEWSSTRHYLPALFRLFCVRRLPVFAIVLVWALVAAKLDSGAHWEVRRLRDGNAAAPLELSGAWKAWQRVHARPGTPPAPGARRRAVPLIVVAAEGGGIRAATWTALVMRCLFEGHGAPAECALPGAPRAGNVFLASGVSGGSVGLAEFTAHLASGDADPGWVEQRVRGDYVSPQLAWQLLVELPRSLLHFGAADRAEILERTWERSWSGPAPNPLERGLLGVQTDPERRGRMPLLVLNGASVYDGCWILTSALRAGWRPDAGQDPGTCLAYDRFPGDPDDSQARREGSLPTSVDVTRYLCPGEDVRLSTAALLSARFPLVSPAGRLSPCGKTQGRGTRDTKYVLDGGDIESSAAETALAAWAAVRDRVAAHNDDDRNGTCVVPFFVQVDNGYATSVEAGIVTPPNQLTAPLTSVLSGRDARPQQRRAASLLEFTSPLRGVGVTLDGDPLTDRYAHIVPLGHPGNEPTLGWALSEQSQQDLRRELASEATTREIAEIQRWLTAELRCTTGP